MRQLWGRAREFLERDLWRRPAPQSRWLRAGRSALQLVVVVAQGVASDQLLLRASALTYFTLLSLIPLLALMLAVVSGLGLRQDLAQVIVSRVAAGSPEAAARILEIVRQVDLGRLGSVGAALLLVTTVLGLRSVEGAFNTIWGVAAQRPLMRRFADYLAVLIVAPLLLGVALSMGTTLQSQALVARLLEVPWFAAAYRLGLRHASLVLLWAGFAFLYWFLPNTHVRVRPALLGGLAAALLFTLAQRVYVGSSVGVARSNVLYGGFAALPLLLVWIYLSWVVVLFGAEIAFAHQNLHFFRQAREGEDPPPAAREAVGLAVAAWLACAFEAGAGPQSAEAIADALDVPVRTVRAVLLGLERARVVTACGDGERGGYQLGRSAEKLEIPEVLLAVRGRREATLAPSAPIRAVLEVLAEMDRGGEAALEARSLAALARRLRAGAAEAAAPSR